MANKIKTYLGFARRAGKLTLGVNAVKATREKIYLLVADRGASQNTKKEILSLKQKLGCPLIEVDDLEGLTGKALCKLAAVREEHLANAVIEYTANASSGETEGTYGI